MENKVLVVGAGLSGATIARLFAEQGSKVEIIDKRETIGGNTYDYKDENGIIVQQYGPHIFHTENQQVFEFLSRFTSWNKYEHRVLAKIKNKHVPVPFNLTSLYALYKKEQADEVYKVLVKEIGLDKKVPIMQLKSHANPSIREFADFVYQNIFYKYTKKQWGMKPEELGEKVMSRVPIYLSYEDRYFTDKYQAMPVKGFTKMVEKMLDHENITVKLNADAKDLIQLAQGKVIYDGKAFDGKIIYTGRADELFDYKFGELPYRSLTFKFKTLKTESYQDAAVVNYTCSKPYTRISEFTKFTSDPEYKTVIVKEYPKACKKGDIPYYPIQIEANQKLFDKYKEEKDKYPNLWLLGRLANYKYVNMDVAVADAMALFEQIK
jgi:UDP-galactopyranose mutase